MGSLLGWLFFFSATAFAAEVGAYDSNGVTSFYGVYEAPEDPEDLEDPEGQKNPNVKVPGSQQNNQHGEMILPQTGSDQASYIQVAGGLCLLAALVILLKRGRQNEKGFFSNGYRRY